MMTGRSMDQLPSPWPGRIWRFLRSMLITVILSAGLFLVISTVRGGVALPEEAPDFQTTTLDGKPVHLAALRGKPVVLYFWASWCPVCKVTSPSVDGFASRHPDVPVLAIAMEEADAARAYLAGAPRSFVPVAENEALANAYSVVRALPTTVIVDAQGKVTWSRQGALLPYELDLRVP
jgi:thiol-disulfide isomerase/thioredoxin